jgi:hypothetical protein
MGERAGCAVQIRLKQKIGDFFRFEVKKIYKRNWRTLVEREGVHNMIKLRAS